MIITPEARKLIKHILPATGQTTSYKAGDDGALQIGYKKANRFVDVVRGGNNLVFDRATQLYWPKTTADLYAINNNFYATTWANGFSLITALNTAVFGGFNDWYMPNALQLLSIIDFETRKTTQKITVEVNVSTGAYYWTSTVAELTTSALELRLSTAGLFLYLSNADKGSLMRVIICRGGK